MGGDGKDFSIAKLAFDLDLVSPSHWEAKIVPEDGNKIYVSINLSFQKESTLLDNTFLSESDGAQTP